MFLFKLQNGSCFSWYIKWKVFRLGNGRVTEVMEMDVESATVSLRTSESLFIFRISEKI